MNDRPGGNASDSEAGSDGKSDAAVSGGSVDPAMLARLIRKPGPAPVHLWDPPYCGEMDLRITRDGSWIHEGRPIRRAALVRLFASVLKKEGERFFLVTPVEKVGIQVEDCPFVATGVDIADPGPEQKLIFSLNTGDQAVVDEAHPLSVSQVAGSDEPHPIVHVRDGLNALLTRSVFYQVVAAGETCSEGGVTRLEIRSCGDVFELGQL
ncbi:MAG: DUF1285 domain-containing protein [Gammaproteobacteria bacterium]